MAKKAETTSRQSPRRSPKAKPDLGNLRKKAAGSENKTESAKPNRSGKPQRGKPTSTASLASAAKAKKKPAEASQQLAQSLKPDRKKNKQQLKLEKSDKKKKDKLSKLEKRREKKRDKKHDKKRDKKRGKQRNRTAAEKADKFLCYQKSVQCPEHDVDFFEQAYRDVHHRRPVSLREDFCGTFAVCCEWVTRGKDRTAVGVDLCAETLQWGRDHCLAKLSAVQQSQIRLLQQDVRVKNLPPVDVLAAQNFSFWIFQTRPQVITYLRAARENLKPGGIMVLDMMGGGDCYREGNEDKKIIGKGKKKFNYFWKMVSFNPFNNNARFTISFRFRDGSKLENAFEYDWRFWTIPEVREMLAEAGFTSSQVYFENEEDDTVWESREHAPSHSVWLAYIVAVR